MSTTFWRVSMNSWAPQRCALIFKPERASNWVLSSKNQGQRGINRFSLPSLKRALSKVSYNTNLLNTLTINRPAFQSFPREKSSTHSLDGRCPAIHGQSWLNWLLPCTCWTRCGKSWAKVCKSGVNRFPMKNCRHFAFCHQFVDPFWGALNPKP